MKNSIVRRWIAGVGGVIACLAIVVACTQDGNIKPVTAQSQTMTAQDNNQMVMATQDVMDITAGAFTNQGVSGARTATEDNGDNSIWMCSPSISGSFSIDRTHKDSLIYQGSITIDYGNGSTCNKDSTAVRTGKITDAFMLVLSGGKFNLTESITLQAFKRDSVQFDGVFISKSSSADLVSVEIQNAKITYADQTFATWSGMLNIVKGSLNETWHKERNAFKKITGSIKGIARGGADFSAEITNEIVFKNSCSRKYPVSGTIKITNGSTDSTVDYGDGSCDRTYTIETGGTVTTHTFGKEHSEMHS